MRIEDGHLASPAIDKDETNTTRSLATPPTGATSPAHRWVRFLVGLSLLLAFSFGVVPVIQRLAPVREVCDVIEKYDVEATALFYTESDVSCEAEASIRDSLRYRKQ